MFTVRMERGNMHRVVDVDWYQVSALEDGTQAMTLVNGQNDQHIRVTYNDEQDADPAWHDVYVMNSTGRTIEKIRPARH